MQTWNDNGSEADELPRAEDTRNNSIMYLDRQRQPTLVLMVSTVYVVEGQHENDINKYVRLQARLLN